MNKNAKKKNTHAKERHTHDRVDVAARLRDAALQEGEQPGPQHGQGGVGRGGVGLQPPPAGGLLHAEPPVLDGGLRSELLLV